jgi:toxin ParE1/3/4
MTRIELAPAVLGDFDRFLAHLASFENGNSEGRISEIVQAIDILTHSPLIGRKVRDGKRELVIGRGSYGYVALYRFVPQIDTVFVLALRSQRELGFARGSTQV